MSRAYYPAATAPQGTVFMRYGLSGPAGCR